MQIHQDYDHSRYAIRSYEPGRLTVIKPLGEVPPHLDAEALARLQAERLEVLQENVVVTPQRLLSGWGPTTPQDLESGHLEALLTLEVEVVILGTGPRQVFPHPRTLLPLTSRGIGVEVMDTAAACRTYNFLISDGRPAAAALML